MIPKKVKKQAYDYANGLEQEYGVRPIIFYTNGYEIYLWNDANGEPNRKIYGFYTKSSIEYMHYKNVHMKKLGGFAPKKEIAGDRGYQIEAIKRVNERFTSKYRKSLLVMATGTGKTRVAAAIIDLLVKADWVKRVLFLCDRRELRKQAHNTFKEYLPNLNQVYVSRNTFKDKDKRIYLATYPAMAKYFDSFDVGFFDLVIADESHRSIYNRYRSLFSYFDALQLGLTATPVNFVERNTYELFNCKEKDPTFYYPYELAVEENYLSDFTIIKHTTKFLREGIKYNQMSDEQKNELENQVEDPEIIDYTKYQVDKRIFNKETDREILRNLMDNGMKIEDNTRLGKSIIFARNHKHALLLNELFDEMYPQYGSKFCAVIDNYVDRAEQLIDDFKGQGNNNDLTIAISVDMLDTGIDIPEVVNLVFRETGQILCEILANDR